MYVKPAEGLSVPDPVVRDRLPSKGREVPRDAYWMRRLRDGDVIETTAPAEPSLEPSLEPAAEGGDL